MTWRVLVLATALVAGLLAPSPQAFGEAKLTLVKLAEKKVAQLPAGPLFWRIETFPGKTEAARAAGAFSLVAESGGKAWLFTLGPAGAAASPGGTKVAEVGPLPPVVAREYVLRINQASGPPGSITPVHSHPGSEAFYVLAGEQSIRSASGVVRVTPGKPEARGGADMAMQVSSTGTTDLHALVMFVVDATKPFSSPATFR
jgi:hypothetical protein